MNSTTRHANSRLRIIVMGYIVRGPLGGLSWHHMQYLMGLAALGHTVHFLEDSDDFPSCYDPARGVTDADPTYGLAYAADLFGRIGLADRWAYHDAHTGLWHGPRADDIVRRCKEADLLLNLSGVNPLRSWVADVPARVLIDTDPAFTQVRHLDRPEALAAARGHTAFFTFGENYGQQGCTIPDDGLPWIATRQPIVLDAWPVTPPPREGRFSTVMQWDSYRGCDYRGVHFGMKSMSFPSIAALPARVGPVLELALGGATAPRADLAAQGWSIRNSLEVTRDPWAYQAYIRASRGEFTVAKHGYVVSNSGWFSERSAAYLASGRPVITQETGFSRWLASDVGVIPFTNADEACAAIAEVEARPNAHGEAAREVAAAWFGADRVLTRLLDLSLAVPAVASPEPR